MTKWLCFFGIHRWLKSDPVWGLVSGSGLYVRWEKRICKWCGRSETWAND